MCEPSSPDQYFIRNHEYGVAQQVLDTIEDEWDELQDEIRSVPTRVEYPIPGLTVYQDGLKCTICGEVFRSQGTIRVHWHKVHRFSAQSHRGKPRPSETSTGQEKREQAMVRVVCQRMFRSQFGSHYIEVRRPGAAYEPTAPVPPASQVAKAIEELQGIWAEQQQQEGQIQAGDIDEANPWLDRTGWGRSVSASINPRHNITAYL